MQNLIRLVLVAQVVGLAGCGVNTFNLDSVELKEDPSTALELQSSLRPTTSATSDRELYRQNVD